MSYKGSFYRKYYVSRLCKKHNKKVIIHLHGSEFKDFYNSGNKKRKEQIKELFSIVDTTVVLGHDWEKFIYSIVSTANVSVINNAISLPNINEKVVRKDRTLLFLGVLIQRKGVIDLLQTVKRLCDEEINNFKLLIAGSGEEENKLREFAKKNKIVDRVDFLGWITNEQKAELMRKSDILVLPSYNEGLPIAILEAMSYGLPIVSTNVGSIAEAVSDNGFLVKPGDVDSLTRSLKMLICNDEVFVKQSRESRKIAEKKFSEEIFFEKIKKIYRDLGE
jgi:glycosyltransferase involved in cell wall biosynthesis